MTAFHSGWCSRYFGVTLMLVWMLIPAPRPCRAADANIGTIHALNGEVEVSHDGGKTWAAAFRHLDLNIDDIIRTGRQSRASILLADRSMLRLDENAQIELATVATPESSGAGAIAKAAAKRIYKSIYRITRGRFWFRTSATLDIQTQTAVMGIRGTEFALVIEPDGTSVLSMVEGQASMENPYGAIIVAAGEEGIARPGEAPRKRILINPQDAVQWALFYPAPVHFKDYYFISPAPEYLRGLLARMAAKPVDPMDLIQKGRLLHDLGRYAEARTAFQQARAHSRLKAQADEGLGWVALQTGDSLRAIDLFNRAALDQDMSLIGLCLAYYKTGRTPEALNIVTQACRRLGDRPHLRIQEAFLQLILGNPQQARDILETAAPAAGSSIGYGLLSNLYLVQNHLPEALAAALSAVQANAWSAGARLDLAWVRQSLFDLPGAMAATRKALELDPENVRGLILMGQLMFGSGHIRKAQDMVNRALNLNPQESLAHSLKGFLELAQHRTGQAMAAFNRAADLDPNSGEPHLGLGIAHMRRGDTQGGLREMQIATLLEPNLALNHTYLGKAFYQVKDFRLAQKAFERAKALDPNDPTPYLYSGIMYTDLNQAVRAIEDLETAVALNDNRAVYRSRFLLDQDRAVKNIDLARTYAALGLDSLARNRAILSLKDDPNNSSAHWFMSNATSDRLETARSERLKAYLLEPANQNAFNTFNTYSSVFEQADGNGLVDVTIGNHDIRDITADFTGSTGDFALRQFCSYDEDDGYKTYNSKRQGYTRTIAKYQIGLKQDLLLLHDYAEGRVGDRFADYDAWAPDDPDYQEYIDFSTITLGYHYRFSPGSDAFLVFQRFNYRSEADEGPLNEAFFDVNNVMQARLYEANTAWTQTYWHLAATHQVTLGTHRLNYGIEYFEGQTEYHGASMYEFMLETPWGPQYAYLAYPETEERITPMHRSLFAYDTWRLHPEWTLEAGLFMESTNNGTTIPAYSSAEYEIERLNPRLGVIYTPDADNTFRLGYYRYLQSCSTSLVRLHPTDVAGFAIGQNGFSSAILEELAAAWDHRFCADSFLSTALFARERRALVEDPADNSFSFQKSRFFGGSVNWNRLIAPYYGLKLGYQMVRNLESEFENSVTDIQKRWRDDHIVGIGLRFVHPTGWGAGIAANAVYQRLSDPDRFDMAQPSNFWLLDFYVEKEFMDKRMSVMLAS